MFIDSRNLSAGAEIDIDICIVGAGPAGISLAKEFVNSNHRVCLLESGDVAFDEATASLGDGEHEGDPFAILRGMRHRQFGGMSNLWNVVLHQGRIGLRLTDLDSIDFEKRDWVPYSGWPITKQDLIPYYKRAHTFSQLGDYDYSTTPWETESTPRVLTKNNQITSSMFKFGPRDIYTEEYRTELAKSKNILTYTNANAIDIEADEAGKTIKRIKVACLTGNKFFVNAKVFVLAAGGMENARLLLLSNGVQKNGLGNQYDVVGRYFMDHPILFRVVLLPRNNHVFDSLGLYDKRRVNNETVMGHFKLSEQGLRRNKLLHMCTMLFPRCKNFESEGKTSSKILVSAMKEWKSPTNTLTHLRNVAFQGKELISDFYTEHVKRDLIKPNLSEGEWSTSKSMDRNKFVKFEVITQTEQAPHPDNRVTLSKQRDKLGCPKVKLTNYWNEIDKESVIKAQEIFREEFAAAELGTLLKIPLDQLVVNLSAHHNMGTTRMNENPKQGVVNAHCKVHGISNLFIAGSSVFPTGGYANPTLTIIALAIRLADHIKEMC